MFTTYAFKFDALALRARVSAIDFVARSPRRLWREAAAPAHVRRHWSESRGARDVIEAARTVRDAGREMSTLAGVAFDGGEVGIRVDR